MIAISYRREDSLPIAGRLYDRLQARFGKQNVFMDFDSIPPGVDFREKIKQTIERSKLVIAVIGPRWLGEQSDSSRRIDDPADFVRLEIKYALERGTPIIPLLVDNTLMPKPDKVPPEIEGLAFRNALPLDSGLDFHNHADRLINGICGLVDISKTQEGRASDAGEAHSMKPEISVVPGGPPHRSKIPVWGASVLIVVGTAVFGWYLANQPAQTLTVAPQPSAAATASKQASDAKVKPSPLPAYMPIANGYSVLEFTVSPDHRHGVIAPDFDHYIEGTFQNQIINLVTGRVIGLIQATTGLVDHKVHMNRGGINPARWSEDGTLLLWEVEGRWSPRSLVMVKLAGDETRIEWQTDVLKVVQREMLIRTKKAAPTEYAKASAMNQGSGSAFPDGFVVNVRASKKNTDPITLPVRFHAGLTSNPKGDQVPEGGAELNAELDGLVDDSGTLRVTEFHLSKKPGWQIAVPQPGLSGKTLPACRLLADAKIHLFCPPGVENPVHFWPQKFTSSCESGGVLLASADVAICPSARESRKTAKNLCERRTLPTELTPNPCGRHVNRAAALFKNGAIYLIRPFRFQSATNAASYYSAGAARRLRSLQGAAV